MADTIDVRYSYTIVDELGTTATQVEYGLADPAATLTQLDGQYDTLGGLLDAVIDGAITGGRIDIIRGIPTGAKSAPTAGARVEQTGVLNFSATGSPMKFGEAIPSFSSAKISGGKIDLTDSDVAAFFGQLLSSGIAVLEWTNSNRQPLAALLDAVLSFRKRRKQLSRSSFEREA